MAEQFTKNIFAPGKRDGLADIIKSQRNWVVPPNLANYEKCRDEFSWELACKELTGLSEGQGLNIAFEAVDRHANGSLADHLAIRWLGKDGQADDFSYRRLQDLTNRFANVLQTLGVNKGDRIYALAGRIPELYIGGARNSEAPCRFLPSLLRLRS